MYKRYMALATVWATQRAKMNQLWVRFSLVITLVVVLINVFPAVVRGLFPPPQRPEFRENLPAEVREQIPSERFERYEESVSERIWESTWRSAIVGSAIGLLFGVGLSRTMVKPLIELEKGAKAVATHNLAYRVKEEGTSEIQAVARAFNEMASELEQSETLRRNLLADVTHELRHPVHVLRGNLQGILDGIFPLELEEVVALMEQTEQLTQLVNDLHDELYHVTRDIRLLSDSPVQGVNCVDSIYTRSDCLFGFWV